MRVTFLHHSSYLWPELRMSSCRRKFAVVRSHFSVTFCGLPAALSLILTAAVRVPLAVGLNVTLIRSSRPLPMNPQVWVCAKFPALVPVSQCC